MRWKGFGPHVIACDEGYKVARYRIGSKEYFRPSLQGSFICAPLSTAEEAKRACIEHHKQAK